MSDIVQHLETLYARMAELERKQDGMVTRGPVAEVDTKAKTARLRLGGTDDKPFLSPPIPYSSMMGKLKAHIPPGVGQQFFAVSDAGDFRQGVAVPLTESDKNKSPSDKDDENVVTYGNARFDLKGDSLQITVPSIKLVCGGVTFELSSAGIKVTGGKIEHDDKNIGKTHKHLDVTPGGAKSGLPTD